MNKLLLAGLAGVAAVAAATPAQAHPNWHYVGGCGFFTLSDGTDTPQTTWDGEIHAAAAATDPTGLALTASITVDCELRINGATPGTIVFSCSTPGIGFVSCPGQFSFNADPDDIVTMCDIVTVNGETHKDCGGSISIDFRECSGFVDVACYYDDGTVVGFCTVWAGNTCVIP